MRLPGLTVLFLAATILVGAAVEIPVHVRSNIGLAKLLLESQHEPIPLWPKELKLGSMLSNPKPINSSDDLKALLRTAPEAYLGGSRFGEVSESDGWLAASLDAPPGKSLWIHGVIVQKGSTKLYVFTHW